MNSAYYELNAELFAEFGLNTAGGTPVGETFVAPFLTTSNELDFQADVIQFVSGAICAAGVMIVSYYGLLVMDRGKIKSTSGKGSVQCLSWLERVWSTLALPNPAMIYGLTGLSYVDESIVNRERFEYGRKGAIAVGPGNIPGNFADIYHRERRVLH